MQRAASTHWCPRACALPTSSGHTTWIEDRESTASSPRPSWNSFGNVNSTRGRCGASDERGPSRRNGEYHCDMYSSHRSSYGSFPRGALPLDRNASYSGKVNARGDQWIMTTLLLQNLKNNILYNHMEHTSKEPCLICQSVHFANNNANYSESTVI